MKSAVSSSCFYINADKSEETKMLREEEEEQEGGGGEGRGGEEEDHQAMFPHMENECILLNL